MKSFITSNSKQTQKLGEILAKELHGGSAGWWIICLSGELGSGKTTFTQGLLKGLGIKGPHTSPTFTIVKEYKVLSRMYKAKKGRYKTNNTRYMIQNVYHIDAYRVTSKDILNLGWKEITKDKNNIIIIEWADRIKKIIPKDCLWIKFKWLDKNKREITLASS